MVDTFGSTRFVWALALTFALLLIPIDRSEAAPSDWNCSEIDFTLTGNFRPGRLIGPSHIETDISGSGRGVCSRTTGLASSSAWTGATITIDGEAAPEHCTARNQIYSYNTTVTVDFDNGEPGFTTTLSLDVKASTTNEAEGEWELGTGQRGLVTWHLEPSDPSYPGRCDRDMTQLAGGGSFMGPTATDRVIEDETTPHATPMPGGLPEAVQDLNDTPAGDIGLADDVPQGSATDAMTWRWQLPTEVLVEPQPGQSLAAATSVASCTASLAIDGFIRVAPNPDRAGFYWRGKRTCRGPANVVIGGSSSAFFTRTGQRIKDGNTCEVFNNGFPCRTGAGYIAPNKKRHNYTVSLRYFHTAPARTKWRPVNNDVNGIDTKSCRGYGTNVLDCTYSRFFSVP